jgi:hypothetical protein
LQAYFVRILKVFSSGFETACVESPKENQEIFGTEQIFPVAVLARELQDFARAECSSDRGAPDQCCGVAVIT